MVSLLRIDVTILPSSHHPNSQLRKDQTAADSRLLFVEADGQESIYREIYLEKDMITGLVVCKPS